MPNDENSKALRRVAAEWLQVRGIVVDFLDEIAPALRAAQERRAEAPIARLAEKRIIWEVVPEGEA